MQDTRLKSFCILIGTFAAALMSAPNVGRGQENPSGDLGLLQKTALIFRVEIIWAAPEFPVATTYGMIGGSTAPASAIQKYAGLFASEFSLYPPGLVKRVRLRRIVLCEQLSFAGQRRNAVPDFEHDTLYLDVSRGASNPLYLRKVVHHEFFHMIDNRDDGLLYQDERWKALNHDSFRYGNGGRESQNLASTSVLTEDFPGFLNHYSTTGVEEDKAEMFANLIVEPNYVRKRTAMDPVLAGKAVQMKQLLRDFCPEMDDAFWERIATNPRGRAVSSIVYDHLAITAATPSGRMDR